MKVRELVEKLLGCNQEADIIGLECRNFNREDYRPIVLEGLFIDHDKKCFPQFKQKESSLNEANVIIIK